MVEQLAYDYPDRFAPITMHANSDGFDVPWGQHRLDFFYGVAGATPTFMVDALWNCQSADYRYYVELQLAEPTDTTLDLSANSAGGSAWDVTARVCLESGSSRPMRIFIAATLDHHPDLQSYSTNLLMQNVEESDITLSVEECANVTSRITFDSVSMANTSDIVVIAWAQQPSSSAPTTVYQAGIMRWPFPAGSQLATIEVDPTDVTMAVGEQIDFTATGSDQSGADISLDDPTWSLGGAGSGTGTFDPGSGSASTTFTATAVGTRQIFCEEGGVSGAAIVTITDSPRLAAIEIDPSSTTVNVDGEIAFSATGRDQYGEAFPLTEPTWAVSGDGDGTFDSATGTTTTFTGSYPGNAVVTCSQDDVSGTAAIEITGDDPRLATIELNPASAQLRVGDEIDFTATGSDQYGRAIELADPVWRLEGDGDGLFDPVDGNSTTTFTATEAGSVEVFCSASGIQGASTVDISSRGLPAPRRTTGRVTP